jgi:hypothetical protein
VRVCLLLDATHAVGDYGDPVLLECIVGKHRGNFAALAVASSLLGACQDPAYRGLDTLTKSDLQCAAVFRHKADDVAEDKTSSSVGANGFDKGANIAMRAAWFEQKLHARNLGEDWASRVEAASDAMDKMKRNEIESIAQRCTTAQNGDPSFMQQYRAATGSL